MNSMHRTALALPLVALLGCGSSTAATPAPAPAPEVGPGSTHDVSSVVLTEIAGGASGLAGLNQPRDLAFNPARPDEMWVVNRGDDSVVIVSGASTPERTAERRKDAGAAHFMTRTSSLAFGGDPTTFGIVGTFATCGESRNENDSRQPSNDFMGPALWSSDLGIFAKKNPIGLGSHLDMLHNSPLCVGIAHETGNVYWAFGGLKNELIRYDFGADHDVGQDDHSDGSARYFATGQLKYVEGIPSHMVFHARESMLYVADTGNARIVKLDTRTGTPGKRVATKEPMKTSEMVDNSEMFEVVGAAGELTSPSGLEMKGDFLYVGDAANGRISAFTLDGKRVNYLDTGLPPGALNGIAFGPDGKLYFADSVESRILRIDPKR